MENAARAREQQWDKKVAAGSRRRKVGRWDVLMG